MSENLDLVRSICADWERGDYFSRIDWVDPEIEFVWADGPDPDSWTGPDEIAKAWSDQLRLYQQYRAIAEEFRELDHERVLVLTRTSGRGKISSAESGALGGKARCCSKSATAKWRGSPSTGTATAPSPTSAWRRRRCRGRTWTSSWRWPPLPTLTGRKSSATRNLMAALGPPKNSARAPLVSPSTV